MGIFVKPRTVFRASEKEWQHEGLNMIHALLHGKLSRKQQNMEDILTSNVFGLLQYVPPECGLFPFLAEAVTKDGDHPLANLRTRRLSGSDTVKYRFWPRWECEPPCTTKYCEPDVVLEIPGDPLYLVLVEAKFRSGKSSTADDQGEGHADEADDYNGSWASHNAASEGRSGEDQLAHEWKHFVAKYSEALNRRARPVLVYLTSHPCRPTAELQDSIPGDERSHPDSHSKPSTPSFAANLCWLSWRTLPELFRPQRELEPHLRDIVSLTEKLELIFYKGISSINPIQVDWRFKVPEWKFTMGTFSCAWSFKR